jgi:hypothetical protein
MVTFGRILADELVNSPLLTSMGFTFLKLIIRPLCRKNLQVFISEKLELRQDVGLTGVICGPWQAEKTA